MCGSSTGWSSLLRKICYLFNPRRRPILFFFSSLPPFIFCFIFHRKYRQGYRGVLREDLVFTCAGNTIFPIPRDLGYPRVLRWPLKFASPRYSRHPVPPTLVGSVLFFRWLAKLARTDSISNYGHSILPRKTCSILVRSRPSRCRISKKEYHNVPLSADRYNRAGPPISSCFSSDRTTRNSVRRFSRGRKL